MNRIIDIPADGLLFAGHFPGRPILPAVTLLALVANATSVRVIRFLRLRQLVAPGDRLQLIERKAADGVRIEVQRDGTLVANGELAFGESHSGATETHPEPAPQPPPNLPPLDLLLPHRPPMRFVTAVLRADEQGAMCATRIPEECALVAHGSAPALAAIEAAAQTAAAWEAVRRRREGGHAGARVGYLVALRDIELLVARVPANQAMVASVRLTAAAPPLTHYAVDVSLQGTQVLRGTVATFLTDEVASQ
jgi:predicted hotdog family 3-hydroxylacyl-ACP dehydratase